MRGFVINKFRGDLRLFDDGLAMTRAAHRLAGVRRACPGSQAARPAGGGRGGARSASAKRRRAAMPRRRAAAAAHRQLRRFRSAAAEPDVDGRASSRPGERFRRRRPDRAARLQGDHRRSRRLARGGLGHRHRGATCAAAARCSASAAATRCWARAISDPARHGRPAGQPCPASACSSRDRARQRQDADRDHRDRAELRCAGAGLRDARRAHRGPGAPADAAAGRRPDEGAVSADGRVQAAICMACSPPTRNAAPGCGSSAREARASTTRVDRADPR